ncbi:MAG: 2-phosphosulfolactate phosphatase [Candidatus Eisenbacteria bacterium]
MSDGKTRFHVFFTPHELGDASVKGKGVVVVDVLRFGTTLARAFEMGADLVIPVASTEDVTRLASTLDRKQIVLCGERDGVRIEGYGLGNSPEAYSEEAVMGKTLVMTTTNGTASVARAEGAKEILVASLVNLHAVVSVLTADLEWIVLCSGRRGRFALEDALCAGAIVAGLRERGIKPSLNDAGRSAEFLFRSAGDDLPRILAGTESGELLHDLGCADDIAFCARVDSIPIVPRVQDGRIPRPE